MRCAKYSEFGRTADVLQVVDQELPLLKENEVRLSVLASPVNPSDYLQVEGRYGVKPPLPAIAGYEGIGRVVDVGKNVTHLRVGDVAILPPGRGTWATEQIADAEGMYALECTNLKQLAMLTVNPPTAMALLKNLKRGDWVIQTAANSAVGHYIIQLAKKRGINTVNIVRSEDTAKHVRNKGGDVVLVDGDDLAKRIAVATNDAPISLAVDAVGGPQAARLADALAPGGTIINYGSLSGQPLHVSPVDLIFKNIEVKGFWLVNWLKEESHEEVRSTMERLVKLIESGALKTEIDSMYSLENIHDAIRRAKTPGRNGKVLLLPNGDIE